MLQKSSVGCIRKILCVMGGGPQSAGRAVLRHSLTPRSVIKMNALECCFAALRRHFPPLKMVRPFFAVAA